MNDDDFVNTSPHETLSDFWANRYNVTQSEKFEPGKSRVDSGQKVFRRPNKSETHNIISRQHLQMLDHNAAKHKIACRPKRNHPHPRKKKVESKDLNDRKKDLNFVATVNKLCGGEISSLQHNSFHVGSSVDMKIDNVTNCDTFKLEKASKKKQSKIKSEPEKLSGFLQRFIGVKKLAPKHSANKDSVIQESNKATNINISEHKVTKTRSKKKPPPPPPSSTKQELVTMNVKTIGHDSGLCIKQF